jgi:hypothetical protein
MAQKIFIRKQLFCADYKAANLYQGGLAMDATSFCGMMQTEITSLKAKVYDIMQAVEKTKDTKKKMLAPQIAALHTLIEHLSEMNERLAKECPLDWSKEKEEIEAKKAELLEEIDIWDSDHLAGLVDN